MSTTFFHLIASRRRIYIKLTQILGSAWCFYFRWPVVKVQKFAPEGIILGGQFQLLIYSIAALFFTFLGSGATTLNPAFLAFIVLGTFTGLLHEDGFADSLDALGVPHDGSPEAAARVEAALKDSRLGSFGVSGLIVLWLLRFALLRGSLSVWLGGAAILCSRSAVLVFAVGFQRFALGQGRAKMSDNLRTLGLWGTVINAAVCLVAAIAVLFWLGIGIPKSLGSVLISLGLGGAVLWGLTKRLGRVAGDSIGAAICVSELTLLYSLFLWS